MATFEASVSIDCPHQDVFDFLIRPANTVRTSPPQISMKMIEAPELLEFGSRIEFEVSGLGPVQRMIHEITAFDGPKSFIETQRKGPLKSFVHEHLIEQDSGGVVVVDRILFEPPGGLAGFVVTESLIQQSLSGGFEHRHAEMKRILEGAAE